MTTRICLSARPSDLELLRSVTARMTAAMGRTSYVGVLRYGLRLVAAHLDAMGIAPARPPAGPDPH